MSESTVPLQRPPTGGIASAPPGRQPASGSSLPGRSAPRRPRESSPHRRDLIAWDYILLNTSFAVGVVVSYGWVVAEWAPWRMLVGALLVNGLWTALAMGKQVYGWYERVPFQEEVIRLLKVVVFHFAVVTIAYYNLGLIPRQPWCLWLIYGLFTGSLLVQRALSRRRIVTKVAPFNYIVVGGKPHHVDRLLDGFAYAFGNRAKPLGRFGRTPHDILPTIGDYADVFPYVASTPDIDKLVFIYSGLTAEQEAELIALCRRRAIDIEVVPRESTLFTRNFKVQRHGVTTVLTAREEPLSRLSNKMLKRAFDIVVSGVFLVAFYWWIYLVVGALIKWESRGPVLFKQRRSGYWGHPFEVLKFRTMGINAEADRRQASAGDARVTRMGAVLRKLSIDELPQFVNVWRGEMSVVGPRPHMLAHTEEYSRLIDTYDIRHQVKPGVTGWAQVNGWRGPTPELYRMQRRVEHDVWYLDNWTLLLDVKCVILTVVNAIRGEENAI